jgi:hypothetical protein
MSAGLTSESPVDQYNRVTSRGSDQVAGIPVSPWKSGERGWIRTIDPCLKRALLCQLSYAPALLLTAAEHYPTTRCDAQLARTFRPRLPLVLPQARALSSGCSFPISTLFWLDSRSANSADRGLAAFPRSGRPDFPVFELSSLIFLIQEYDASCSALRKKPPGLHSSSEKPFWGRKQICHTVQRLPAARREGKMVYEKYVSRHFRDDYVSGNRGMGGN